MTLTIKPIGKLEMQSEFKKAPVSNALRHRCSPPHLAALLPPTPAGTVSRVPVTWLCSLQGDKEAVRDRAATEWLQAVCSEMEQAGGREGTAEGGGEESCCELQKHIK